MACIPDYNIYRLLAQTSNCRLGDFHTPQTPEIPTKEDLSTINYIYNVTVCYLWQVFRGLTI